MSLLTNNSAMVALQTLKGINKNLEGVQSQISTGKEVGSAKDNAAVWAISKVMESDVKGFKEISDSLSLGGSTVAVGANAAETVTDLLTDIKGKIVASQEDNVDRGKIQTDIEAMVEQVKSVVGAAQFNGLNLVDGSQTDFNANGNEGVNILSSLDRDANGGVSASQIGVDSQNLSTTAGTDITAGSGTGTLDATTLTEKSGSDDTIELATFTFLDSSAGAAGTAALKGSTAGVDTSVTNGLMVGDALTLEVGNTRGTYRVREGDDKDAVTAGLKNALQDAGISTDDFTLDITTTDKLVITNETSEAGIGVSFEVSRGSGALADLENIDVSTSSGAETALSSIEGMIDSAISAAAEFGSAQGRIDMQNEFIGKLTDSLKSGIGSLVDADMEEASARLQALQVQQQLGTQALSIANQAPQSILSLFR